MKIEATSIADVLLITPQRFQDHRGFFSETYSVKCLREHGIDLAFVQDNHSFSVERGTVRGLHYQAAPFAQAKLVRVTRGRILDVAVDIRQSSPIFGQHVSAELSADNWNQLLIPIGFAHGFVTLEPDTEVVYKVTNFYSAEHDHGIAWDDPTLDIPWGIKPSDAIISEKDSKNPTLSSSKHLFR